MAAETVAGAANAAAEQGSSGLPQFDPTWWPGEMAAMLVIFAVLYVLFAKVFVPKMGGTIAAREGRIEGDIAAARRLKAEAEAQAAAAAAQAAEARSRAQKLAADAKAKAKGEADALAASEEAKLGEKLAKAEAQIAAARDKAMGNVAAIASDTAQSMVEKLTGKPMTVDEMAATAIRA